MSLPDLLLDGLDDLANSSTTSHHHLQLNSGAIFASLKALNRSVNLAIRSKKQHTGNVRLAMDQTHLRLQNLLYERRHLEREIEKCNQFASIYQDITLHKPEEFMLHAPEEARTQAVLENDHQLMLNRLSFELAERYRLEEKRKSLIATKESKMKEYRDQEKLVNEWFSGGTGLERAVTDLQKQGNNVVKRLGLSTDSSLMEDPAALEPSTTSTVPKEASPAPPPSIPTGPRVRS